MIHTRTCSAPDTLASARASAMTRRLKILSDFDGVWTNQGPEAALLLDWMMAKLGELANIPLGQAKEELTALCSTMKRAPHEHGWAPDGRLSAYLDEDPLVESSALARALSVGTDEVSRRYATAVADAGFASMSAFSEFCFRTATESFRDDHPPCIVPGAADLLEAIEDAGAELVIISNSGADKIGRWFQSAGVDAGEGEGHALRLRGSAMKWFLGATDESIEVAGRKIHIDRPKYRAAIEAENPDLIIGDVFSLDLAMPHMLRARGVPAAPSTLVLRQHPHTPSWVTHNRADGAIDHIVDGVGQLPAIVRNLLGT